MCSELNKFGKTDFITTNKIDIKGDKWDSLAIIGKDLGIINTLRLDGIGFVEGDIDEIYSAAVKSTVTILSLMVGTEFGEENSEDLEAILEKAVTKLYSQRGVCVNDLASFEKTKDMRYEDILTILKDFKKSNEFNKNEINLINRIITGCSDYLKIK